MDSIITRWRQKPASRALGSCSTKLPQQPQPGEKLLVVALLTAEILPQQLPG